MAKYLDLDGLTRYDGKIKTTISNIKAITIWIKNFVVVIYNISSRNSW